MLTAYELFWLFSVPAAAFSWYHIVRRASGFIHTQATMPHNPHPRIIFSIAARKLTPALQGPVDSIIESCREAGLDSYDIKLVVDSIDGTVQGADIILVPPDFTCKSKFKARALHYALRHLPNSPEAWILHLDEDARMTAQCVISVVDYIQKGGKPVANGPSIFPYDGNLLTFYAEAQRQWTFFWLMDQLDTSIVHWLNGSNLLIRSDVEQTVGWDFVNCYISEDARFGYEATKKLGHIFGWHGGLTIETPPASLKGLLKQRVRWFGGGLLNLRYVPRKRLPRRIYSLSVWLNGFFLGVLFFALLIGVYRQPFSGRFLAEAVTAATVFWLGRYQIGVYENLRFSSLSRVKKVALHIGIMPLAPFVDILCSLPAVLGLLRPPKGFEITAKRSDAGKA